MAGLKRRLKQVVERAGTPLVPLVTARPPKRISAMVRVKNEEEFLPAAVSSVIDLVDEVVIVDNGSVDSTPVIIKELRSRYPAKVQAFSYPIELARYGEEHQRMASSRAGRRSPSFLPVFYNWCLDRCSSSYVLKWDGDTIATDGLKPALEAFRSSSAQVMWHVGLNLHESRTRLIAGRPIEEMEPRLFARRFAHYNHRLAHCETLWSPYVNVFPSFSQHCDEPLYFHLKFCKADRYANLSADVRLREIEHASPGPPVSPDHLAQLRRWSIV